MQTMHKVRKIVGAVLAILGLIAAYEFNAISYPFLAVVVAIASIWFGVNMSKSRKAAPFDYVLGLIVIASCAYVINTLINSNTLI